MSDLELAEAVSRPPARNQPFATLFAFGAIYFVWGSTYLAIRVLVATVPPLYAAGLRFLIAGLFLYLWSRLRGVPSPSRMEWRNLSALGVLMFLIAYGGLFWAEKTMPSGIASLLVATIPVWTAIFEIFVFKKDKLGWPVIVSIVLGLAGVALLASRTGAHGLALLPCLAILAAQISWSLGTVLSKNFTLPSHKSMSAAGQMITGGCFLLIASGCAGELHPWPHLNRQAALALLYLIVAGSILAFTAYTWLLGRMSATKVSSYAYVNPVIALAIGYWFGGEALSLQIFIGAALVLASVLLLLMKQRTTH